MTSPIAVLFQRLGPYHHARVGAVAKLGPVAAVEYSALDPTYAWATVAPNGRYPVHTLFSESHVGSQSLRRIRQRLWEVLDGLGPSAVAVPGWYAPASLLALEWCQRSRVPAVLMSESQEMDAKRSALQEFIKRRVVRQCAAGLVGGQAHRLYLEALGMPGERVFDGYDVIDNEHFAAGADEARRRASDLRRGLGLPERYFLAVNRFVPKKNLGRLLEAYGRYRRAAGAQAWSLVLLGDGCLRPELLRLRDRLGLADYVSLPGFKQYDELPVYFGLAQAFVHASTVEQWGLVVNEAMAAGLPVLVSKRCGCALDLVSDGVNGHTFDPFDTEDLSQRLASLTSNPGLLASMGHASREIIARWSTRRFAEGLRSAVAVASTSGRPRAGLTDLLVLRGLALR